MLRERPIVGDDKIENAEDSANQWPADANRDARLRAYRNEPMSPGREPTVVMHLNCPRCRLRVTIRWGALPVQYCARCLARHRVAIELHRAAEPPPRDELITQRSA